MSSFDNTTRKDKAMSIAAQRIPCDRSKAVRLAFGVMAMSLTNIDDAVIRTAPHSSIFHAKKAGLIALEVCAVTLATARRLNVSLCDPAG